MNKKTCPWCAAPVEVPSRFCNNCGNRVDFYSPTSKQGTEGTKVVQGSLPLKKHKNTFLLSYAVFLRIVGTLGAVGFFILGLICIDKENGWNSSLYSPSFLAFFIFLMAALCLITFLILARLFTAFAEMNYNVNMTNERILEELKKLNPKN